MLPRRQAENNQTNGSTTEATLILCGYLEEVRRRKIRKFAYRQTIRQSENSSKTEATLILCGYSGERANNRGDSTIKEEDEEKKN